MPIFLELKFLRIVHFVANCQCSTLNSFKQNLLRKAIKDIITFKNHR